MHRLHLIELHDQEWCPRLLRDAATDYLQFIADTTNPYAPIAGRLRAAVERTGATRIVDLCSGAGGPWTRLLPLVRGDRASSLSVLLTDRFPNLAAMERIRAASQGSVAYEPRSVDATQIPADIHGFRTLFASFHHFRPREATQILADAVRQRQGIGVFEVTHRSVTALLLMGLTPLLVLLSTPFVRPFSWARLIWTYLIPVLPFLIFFDGIVSSLRTYSPSELTDLTKRLGDHGYVWEIGEEATGPGPVPLTYLIGWPANLHQMAPVGE